MAANLVGRGLEKAVKSAELKAAQRATAPGQPQPGPHVSESAHFRLAKVVAAWAGKAGVAARQEALSV